MSIEREIGFGFELLTHLTNFNESIVFSPASILNGFSTILAGDGGGFSEGEIANYEMVNGIPKGNSLKETLLYYSKEAIKLADNISTFATNIGDVKIKYINKVFVSQNASVLLTRFFENEEKLDERNNIQKLDFKNTETAEKAINTSIEKATNGQTQNIINSENISSKTQIIIINTLHFSGRWNDCFLLSNPIEFKSKSQTRIIQGIRKTAYKKGYYNSTKKWDSVGIPYLNYTAWLYVVLPKKEKNEEDGLSKLIQTIDYSLFQKFTEPNEMDSNGIDICLPQIEAENTLDLNEILSLSFEIVKKAFNNDFKKFENNIFKKSPEIAKMFHKSVIKIDKTHDGFGESKSRMVNQCRRLQFTAKNPFLYFITQNESSEKDKKKKIYIPKKLLFLGTFC